MKASPLTTASLRANRSALLLAACLLGLAFAAIAQAAQPGSPSGGHVVRMAVVKPVAAPAPAPAVKKDFVVYDTTAYKHKPDNLKEFGFQPMPIVYEGEFWAPRVARLEPDLALARKAAARVAPQGPIVCLDIEALLVFNKPPQEIAANIRRLAGVADAMHAAQPQLKLGYYLLLPVRDYWTPVGNDPAKMRAWAEANDSLKGLASHLDVIFPSLYTFYDDPEGWKKYAKANILEAKRYGKPVYPFLWPVYHDSNKLLGGKPIPADVWRMQLETCLEYADGVVIWGGYKELWQEQAGWWQETKAFLARLKAAKGGK